MSDREAIGRSQEVPAVVPDGGASRNLGRRAFLGCATVGIGAATAGKIVWDRQEAMFRSDVFIARAASYDDDLVGILRQGLSELGLGRSWIRNKSVLLKPNLVEPSREAPHINTHPAVVR